MALINGDIRIVQRQGMGGGIVLHLSPIVQDVILVG